MKQIIFLLFLLSCTAVYAQQQDSVTIHGRVTDYNGQPIDSASVWWQNPQFNDIIEAITDKDGHYTYTQREISKCSLYLSALLCAHCHEKRAARD